MPQFNRRRERELPPPSGSQTIGTLVTRLHPNPQIIATEVIKSPFKAFGLHEVTHDSKRIGPPYLDGGPFASFKVYVDHNTPQGFGEYTTRPAARTLNSPWYTYTGGWVPPSLANLSFVAAYHAAGGTSPSETGLLDPGMADAGEEAYNRMKPKIERGGVAVALAEAREIPGMLKGAAKVFHESWQAMGGKTTPIIMQPKKLADDFLATQFGWIPFIKDLVAINDVFQNSLAYMDRISKQNGRWINKRVSLAGSESSEVTHTDLYSPGIGPWDFRFQNMCQPVDLGGFLSFGEHTRTASTKVDRWATGSWKYYLPVFDRSIPSNDSGWAMIQRNLILHGARLNPSTIWQATRWSWLIDWFSNVGTLIDRGTAWAEDSVASRYMFLMSHSMTNMTYTAKPRFWDKRPEFKWQNSVDVKNREEAGSPFGFTFGLPLTARQLMILGAMGITRRVPGQIGG